MCKLSKRQDNVLSFIFCSAGILFLLYLAFIKHPKREKELEEQGCYTYCITYNKRFVYRHGIEIFFNYYYKGVKYSEFDTYEDGYNYNGGIYLIRISKLHPEYCKVYFEDGEIDTSKAYYKQIMDCD